MPRTPPIAYRPQLPPITPMTPVTVTTSELAPADACDRYCPMDQRFRIAA
jgi:hypothetical protein